MPGSVSSGTIRSGWLTEASRPQSILTDALTDVSRRLTLERAVQATTAATILVFVLASGSILSWLAACALPALAGPARARCAVRRARAPARRAGLRRSAFVDRRRRLRRARTALGRSGRRARCSASPTRASSCSRSATCGALAWAAWGRPDTVSLVVDGVLLGLALVAVGGLVLLAVEYDRAVMPATTEFAARYQGLGGGPNTATMVMALGVPLAAQRLLRGERWSRVAAGVAAARAARVDRRVRARAARCSPRSAASRSSRCSRARAPRRKALALGGVAAALLVAVVVMRAPDPLPPGTPSAFVPPFAGHSAESPFEPKGDFVDANFVLRLEDDVGHPGLGVADTRRRTRTLLNSSGRAQAWTGALGLVAERPIAGYGFGLEDKVFVDRYINFHSACPENSYLGLSLQLGAAGILALSTVLRAPVRDRRVRVSRPGRPCSAAARRVRRRRRGRARARRLSVLPLRHREQRRAHVLVWPRSWSRLRRQRENVQQLAEHARRRSAAHASSSSTSTTGRRSRRRRSCSRSSAQGWPTSST